MNIYMHVYEHSNQLKYIIKESISFIVAIKMINT